MRLIVTFDDEFGDGGAALWGELHDELDPADLTVLIQEACRITDRLDRLHAAIQADGIVELIERDGDVIEVKVDNVLSEARQQAGALQRLLADIAKRRGDGAEEPESDGLADL
ncbi:Terminase small subunit [Tsukamurella ocularis]